MNLTIQQTPQHTTFDGFTATYAVIRDALTARRVAMFQVVDLGEGVTQYRTMDRRTMPPDFSLNDAIKLAMVDETKRRAQRPPIVKRRAPYLPPRENKVARHILPMHLPPTRGYRPVQDGTPPMRRLLCTKLAARAARKAVA